MSLEEINREAIKKSNNINMIKNFKKVFSEIIILIATSTSNSCCAFVSCSDCPFYLGGRSDCGQVALITLMQEMKGDKEV